MRDYYVRDIENLKRDCGYSDADIIDMWGTGVVRVICEGERAYVEYDDERIVYYGEGSYEYTYDNMYEFLRDKVGVEPVYYEEDMGLFRYEEEEVSVEILMSTTKLLVKVKEYSRFDERESIFTCEDFAEVFEALFRMV